MAKSEARRHPVLRQKFIRVNRACSVIPVINGLLYSGVPLAPVVSFWIASPTMDPEKFALTASMLGWHLAVARMVAIRSVELKPDASLIATPVKHVLVANAIEHSTLAC